MIIMIGRIRQESAEAAAHILRECVPATVASLAEEGCSVYSHALDAVDPTVIWAIHVWDDVRAVQAHIDADYYPPVANLVSGSAVEVDLRQYVGDESYFPWEPPG